MDEIKLEVGDCVKVTDEYGKIFNGLVTAIHGQASKEARNKSYEENAESYGWDEERLTLNKEAPFLIPCINVVYVTDDETKTDPYGRQIDRHLTSLGHKSLTTAHGRYFETLN